MGFPTDLEYHIWTDHSLMGQTLRDRKCIGSMVLDGSKTATSSHRRGYRPGWIWPWRSSPGPLEKRQRKMPHFGPNTADTETPLSIHSQRRGEQNSTRREDRCAVAKLTLPGVYSTILGAATSRKLRAQLHHRLRSTATTPLSAIFRGGGTPETPDSACAALREPVRAPS